MSSSSWLIIFVLARPFVPVVTHFAAVTVFHHVWGIRSGELQGLWCNLVSEIDIWEEFCLAVNFAFCRITMFVWGTIMLDAIFI